MAKGDLVDEITTLKEQGGKDIIAYGGATFVSALIQQGLIDEFHLFVNPTNWYWIVHFQRTWQQTRYDISKIYII